MKTKFCVIQELIMFQDPNNMFVICLKVNSNDNEILFCCGWIDEDFGNDRKRKREKEEEKEEKKRKRKRGRKKKNGKIEAIETIETIESDKANQ